MTTSIISSGGSLDLTSPLSSTYAATNYISFASDSGTLTVESSALETETLAPGHTVATGFGGQVKGFTAGDTAVLNNVSGAIPQYFGDANPADGGTISEIFAYLPLIEEGYGDEIITVSSSGVVSDNLGFAEGEVFGTLAPAWMAGDFANFGHNVEQGLFGDAPQTASVYITLVPDATVSGQVDAIVTTSGPMVTNTHVINSATAALGTATTLDVGIIHVGQVKTEKLSEKNSAVAGAYSEKLDVTEAGSTGSVSATGSISQLAAGATDKTDLVLSLSSATTGVVSGTEVLSLASDGTGVDSFGTTSLGSQTVTLTGTVVNYATASVAELSGDGTLTGSGTKYTLNLGHVGQGAGSLSAVLAGLNSATGPADVLSGSFTSSTPSVLDNISGSIASYFGDTNAADIGTISEVFAYLPLIEEGYGDEVVTVSTAGVVSDNLGFAEGEVFGTLAPPWMAGDFTNFGHNVEQMVNGTAASTSPLYITLVPDATVSGQVDAIVTNEFGNNLGSFSGVGAGSAAAGATISLSAANTGAYTEKVTLASTGSDADYSKAEKPVVVTVTGYVAGTGTLDVTGGGSSTMASTLGNIGTVVISDTSGQNTSYKLATGQQFLTVIGGAGNDTLSAEAINQTLSGGAGTDKLIGYSKFGDTFLDTKAGLNGDTIQFFGGNDLIDITDLGTSGVSLAFTGSATAGTLSVSSGGGVVDAITLASGTNLSASLFSISSDGHGGTYLG